jgi:hypothetical protein
MTLTHTCELTGRIAEHLRGTLPPDEEMAFVEHLDRCESCQHSLEQLALGEHGRLLAAAHHLGDEPPTAEFDLHRLMDRLVEQSLVDTVTPEPLVSARSAAVDFLTPPRDPLHLGRLEHYEVTELIARGGMGIVLKAIDERLARTVCLKVLAPQIAASPSARERFLREARAAAAIRSPHVVPIHAVCESGGTIYLVLEYVAGVSLQQHVAQYGPLPIGDVLRIGRDVAVGLAAVHALGLVHRDVKPGNILLDQASGAARLTDFGLARAVDDTSITRDGVVGGTPEYMSPEQARGRALDRRSDLFSLGSVLYWMTTGRLPFEAEGSLATLKRICDEASTPVELLRADVPAALAALIRRLHAKRPADRPASASEVAELLSSIESWCTSPAKLPYGERPARTRPAGWRQHAGGLAAAGIVALGLLCLAGLWQVIVRIQNPDGQTTVIQPPAGATVRLEQNGREVAALKNTSEPQFRALDGHRGEAWSVAIAGSALGLSTGADRWVRVWDLASGKEVQRFDGHASFVYSVAVSPNGRLALSGSGRPLWADKELVNWSVCLWEIESGRELRRLEGRGAAVTGLAFSRDGKRALLGGYEGTLILMDLETWQEIKRISVPPGLWSVDFSPDGTRALTAGGHENEAVIRLWNLADGKEIQRYTGHKFGAWQAVFLSDGRSLLSAGQDETIRHWDTESGRQLAMLRHQGQVTRVAVTADGRYVLAGAWVSEGKHNLRLYDLREAKEIHVFQGHRASLNGVALSADGRLGMVAGNDGSVGVWKMPPLSDKDRPAP